MIFENFYANIVWQGFGTPHSELVTATAMLSVSTAPPMLLPPSGREVPHEASSP